VGAVLEGAYRITRLIGEGGMGAVYEGVQLRLDKRVAIKLMARHLAANQRALARFHREAEITSRLGHPHLVGVIDFGQAESGEPYLVMEYLEGEDLDRRLGRIGRMPIESVVHVVRQVASALSAAHAQGVIHRDLKPANIFLVQIPSEPDFVKVLDFGISKMMAAHTRLTNAAVAVGTPTYMSPEQATGMIDTIDHHIDQWALACIAWEMLLGTPPFVADDSTALLYQIIKMDPHPLTPRVPGLPPAVEVELRRALNKRPADRFPSIRDFSHAFESAALGRPADLTPTPVPVSPTGLLASAIVRDGESPIAKSPDSPPADLAPRDERKPGASPSVTDNVRIRVPPWKRIKPIHAIIVAAGALLLLGAFLLFRSGPVSVPATTKVNNPVVSPIITAPIPPPSATPVLVTPESTEIKPVGLGSEPPRAKRAKTTAPADTAGREKVRQPTRPSPKPKIKRRLIEQL
jgi:Serine/threonine protein kinase